MEFETKSAINTDVAKKKKKSTIIFEPQKKPENVNSQAFNFYSDHDGTEFEPLI